MTIRLGTNPIAWSNDDLRQLGGATPLETCLAEARAAGFEGIELGHKFPREPDALRVVLARHELALVSGWYSSHLLERDIVELTYLHKAQERGLGNINWKDTLYKEVTV